ncbi:hypothetical protein JCM3765_007082 [Sporobolomyces pararoseus]
MANSYITVLGDAKHAAFRLNIAQSANGLAAFIGPLIASKAFYGHDQEKSLGGLQYTYLAVACLGAAIIILFAFAKLPEISEAMVAESQESFGIVDERPLISANSWLLSRVPAYDPVCFIDLRQVALRRNFEVTLRFETKRRGQETRRRDHFEKHPCA